jgi:hypothetical protein
MPAHEGDWPQCQAPPKDGAAVLYPQHHWSLHHVSLRTCHWLLKRKGIVRENARQKLSETVLFEIHKNMCNNKNHRAREQYLDTMVPIPSRVYSSSKSAPWMLLSKRCTRRTPRCENMSNENKCSFFLTRRGQNFAFIWSDRTTRRESMHQDHSQVLENSAKVDLKRFHLCCLLSTHRRLQLIPINTDVLDWAVLHQSQNPASSPRPQ